MANKQDLAGALSEKEIGEVLELEKISASRHWRIQPCSAVTGSGLVDGIDWINRDVGSRIFMLD